MTIRARMKRAGLTQQQLGKKVGVTHAHVNMVIHGKRRLTLPLAVNLAEALGCSPIELLVEHHRPKLKKIHHVPGAHTTVEGFLSDGHVVAYLLREIGQDVPEDPMAALGKVTDRAPRETLVALSRGLKEYGELLASDAAKFADGQIPRRTIRYVPVEAGRQRPVAAVLERETPEQGQRRGELIAGLVANRQCMFAREDLEAMPTGHLEKLNRSLCPVDSGNNDVTPPPAVLSEDQAARGRARQERARREERARHRQKLAAHGEQEGVPEPEPVVTRKDERERGDKA